MIGENHLLLEHEKPELVESSYQQLQSMQSQSKGTHDLRKGWS